MGRGSSPAPLVTPEAAGRGELVVAGAQGGGQKKWGTSLGDQLGSWWLEGTVLESSCS